jgi:plastocyanin
MPRARKIVLAVTAFVAGLALAVVPSLGANKDVTSGPMGQLVFSPDTVTVSVGDSVTWKNEDGLHNVHFDDGFVDPATPASSMWTATRTFTTAGTYHYYCDQHKDAGMAGTVVVTPASTTGPPPTGGGGIPTAPVTVLDKTRPRLRLSGASAQRILRRRGLVVTVRVDEKATITASGSVTVPRASRVLKLRTVKRQVDATGPATFKLRPSRKVRKALARALARRSRLKARVSIVARDVAGNSRTSRRTIAIKK